MICGQRGGSWRDGDAHSRRNCQRGLRQLRRIGLRRDGNRHVSGVGAAAGAMYVAESDAVLPLPADCVVTVVSVPQPPPLQPGPLSVHDTAVLGFEPGTAVSVATIAALALAGTLAGAEIVKVKWLPMVIDAEACFIGSATLCAEIVTDAGAGNTCGAVKFPLASTLPQLLGQEAPDKLQRTVESGCPALEITEVKTCKAPSSTPATLGVSCIEISLTTVTFTVADFVGSAALVAVMRIAADEGRSAGAVYIPAESITPKAEFPPATPLTLHDTEVLLVLVTSATKDWEFPSVMFSDSGVTLTSIMDGGGGGGAAPPVAALCEQPHAALANMKMIACAKRRRRTFDENLKCRSNVCCERGRMQLREAVEGPAKQKRMKSRIL